MRTNGHNGGHPHVRCKKTTIMASWGPLPVATNRGGLDSGDGGGGRRKLARKWSGSAKNANENDNVTDDDCRYGEGWG